MFNLLRQMGIDPTALLGADFTKLHAIVTATVAESVAAAKNGEISVPVKVQAPATKIVGNTLQNSVAVQGRGIPMKASCYCGLQPDKKASLAAMTDIGVDAKQISSWDSVELNDYSHIKEDLAKIVRDYVENCDYKKDQTSQAYYQSPGQNQVAGHPAKPFIPGRLGGPGVPGWGKTCKGTTTYSYIGHPRRDQGRE
ncbi:hypothetical protein B0H17DRAFT_1141713 [Mycena rosella]|uniref:Uncharacterized protein n=1 Tax=Mycena rosella TaxID=1033263 RepID=A0AAD7CZH0_MYCRO|nr:hypothetical protein B0H17DRAFT_1141713 [Mycena rosella]